MTHAEKPFHSIYQTITDCNRCLNWLKYLHIFANCVSPLHEKVLVQNKEEALLTLCVLCACVRPECL